MSLLSHDELLELLEKGVLEGSHPDHVNSASIDICLGDVILIERKDTVYPQYTSLKNKEPVEHLQVNIQKGDGYFLEPGEFILAQSKEIFNLPNNISAEYKLKSSMARIGLDHLNAGWCDAGWHGSVLTLELKNVSVNTQIRLHAGDKIGQMVFFKHKEVPADRSYAVRGRYNKNTEVSGIRPDPVKGIIFEEDEDDGELIHIDLNSPFEDENYDDANKD